MLKLCLGFLLLAAPVFSGAPAQKKVWHEMYAPHFQIYYDSAMAPSLIKLELERIYSKLNMRLNAFAPWMAQEKIKIYIYTRHDDYIKGEFAPPPWSRGIAISAQKLVVIFDEKDISKTRTLLAHEMTHLLFESFFPKRDLIPLWLNEGLAVMMEEESGSAQDSWKQAMEQGSPSVYKPLAEHFAVKLSTGGEAAAISDWYLESYSLVSFLFEPAKSLQFRSFCTHIKDGDGVDAALSSVYHYANTSYLQTAWANWLAGKNKSFKPSSLADGGGPSPSGGGKLQFRFHSVSF